MLNVGDFVKPSVLGIKDFGEIYEFDSDSRIISVTRVEQWPMPINSKEPYAYEVPIKLISRGVKTTRHFCEEELEKISFFFAPLGIEELI